VRYATTRQARWLYLGTAAFGLMYANQETSYLYVLMLGTPLVLLLLWRVYRPGIAMVGALGVALAALVFVLPGEAEVNSSHTATRDPDTNQIVVEEPGPLFGWGPLETEDNAYALRIRNRPDTNAGMSLPQNLAGYFADLWQFFRHPAILSGIALLLACIAALVWLMWLRRDAEGQTAWQRALERDRVVVPVYASLSEGQRWLGALLIFLTIYTLLFTAFFTNVIGVISGTTGSLLYWLAQHNVQRGSQPAYYYLVLLVIYEPLVLLWGGVGMLLVVVGAARSLLHSIGVRWGAAADNDQDETPTVPRWAPGLLPLLLAWWTLTALGIYSWAGEKMPWLIIHVALPLVLLAAWTLQQVGRWAFARVSLAESRLSFATFGGAFVAVVGFGFVSMTRYINSGGEMDAGSMLLLLLLLVVVGLLTSAAGLLLNWATPLRIIPLGIAVIGSLSLIYLSLSAQITPAHILLVTVVLLGMLVLAASMRQGWRWALGALVVWVSLTGGLYTVRSAYRLSYQLGDIPREMLIYTQTSPDVMQAVRGLEEVSLMRTGGLEMPIIYDNETVWDWYLRDFPNATSNGGTLKGPPPEEVQAVLMLYENIVSDPEARDNLSEFRIQRLPLRWWFPENEIYLKTDAWHNDDLDNVSLLSRTMRAPFDERTMVRLWEFLFFRDPGAPLGSTDFIIAVRPQIADHIAPGLGAE
jgi:hypothetical protein